MFSIAQTVNPECVFNMKCVHKIFAGEESTTFFLKCVLRVYSKMSAWTGIWYLSLFRSMLNILNGVGTVFIDMLHKAAIAVLFTHGSSGPLPGMRELLLVSVLFSVFLLLSYSFNVAILSLSGI